MSAILPHSTEFISRSALKDHAQQRNRIIEGEDPPELRPTRRMTIYRKPTVPGVKGGQGHSGAETEDSTIPLVICILVCAGVAVAALLKANA